MVAEKLDVEKEKLEKECASLENKIMELATAVKAAERNRKADLMDEMEREKALLCGKEICLRHVELTILIRERKKARERNPLFW